MHDTCKHVILLCNSSFHVMYFKCSCCCVPSVLSRMSCFPLGIASAVDWFFKCFCVDVQIVSFCISCCVSDWYCKCLCHVIQVSLLCSDASVFASHFNLFPFCPRVVCVVFQNYVVRYLKFSV